jgi:membrane protein implicated in regulation of membrane protease activity
MGNFVDSWRTRSVAARIIFMLIILYCFSSINVLLLALGLTRYIPHFYLNPQIMTIFSVVSFAFVILVSAYHLYTFVARRKRTGDKIADAQKRG